MYLLIKKIVSRKFLIPLVVLGSLIPAAVMASHTFTNGDFETGDLTGWTPFLTSNGTVGVGHPIVVPFDTNGDSIATNSAGFVAGQVVFDPGSFQGGGLHQSTELETGDLTVSADIAARNLTPFGNGEGGRFELLVDGAIIDSHTFGPILIGEILRSTLGATVSIGTAGSHEIRLRVSRPFLAGIGGTPTQFIDNVVLSGTATEHVKTKADILEDSEIPGKGIPDAPGLDEPFNEKGKGEENAGKKK